MNEENIIPLHYRLKKGDDGFYVKEENGLYWLGHRHRGTTDDLNHCVPIGIELYKAFLNEKKLKQDVANKSDNQKTIPIGLALLKLKQVYRPDTNYDPPF